MRVFGTEGVSARVPERVTGHGVLRAAPRQPAPADHRLGNETLSPASSASATTARAMATADGRSGVAALTTQMISWAMCALTTLASLLSAARLAAAANAAGSGWWPSSLATRTVTSYRLGGLFMPGTISEVSDIPGSAARVPPGVRGHRQQRHWRQANEGAALMQRPPIGGLPLTEDDGLAMV